MELYALSATELSRMLREKECSAVELARSVLGRIDRVEDKVRAYLTRNDEGMLAAAARVDEKRAAGETLSPLAGIPIGIKDNICTKGMRTTCASKMLYNFAPPYQAAVVERLLAENAVLTGKLNMDEFAMGSSCENSYFQKTANPHNLGRAPGGSSGGSAAALAAGEAVLTLGSDTGGSIRQPAAYCGVVGLKPTYGAVSRYGLVAFASSLDQIGPMARSVEDAALLFEAIRGADRRDATSVQRENAPLELRAEVRGMRIGVPEEYYGEGVEEAVKAAVRSQLDKLAAAGAEILPIRLPSTPYALSAYYIISSAEASSNLARYDGVRYGFRSEQAGNLEDVYLNTRTEGFGDECKRRIMLGTFVLSSGHYDAYYTRAKLLQQRIAAEFAEAFERCDAIVTPTAPDTAFPLGAHSSDPLKMYASDICTVTVNIAGLPAVSIPCGKDGEGMPIGMQIIGDKFQEGKILSLAKACEEMAGGFNRLPDIE
ncbi:MAG: Asp-tRNA(Asn)/Glu-tRNA(Gln) amidotransferase subunit GatA [Provencibacterium sp.]|jgi:aspartyl-tRNA(Asn)/glutamyl-tRNA(Gln) amidotransferase subunit A|nr:Asp-tRNA(Asn)/Glu-tRNA(Gln) amidotransferase subunit GatA [Provencibacterium sp.]